MKHIDQAFTQKKGIGIIPFIMAGDLGLEVTLDLLQLLDQQGATAIELGVPYSDPLADGIIIQEAAERALKAGITLKQVLEIAAMARSRGVKAPLLLCTYINPILQYGVSSLFEEAKKVGINGLIIPDLPLEESKEFREIAEEQELALIPLVAPTSNLERIQKITATAQGFVYCVSSAGTTGIRGQFSNEVDSFLDQVRKHSPVPIAVGFGISEPQHVQRFAHHADAAIIGSALVKQIAARKQQLHDPEERAAALEEISRWIGEFISPFE